MKKKSPSKKKAAAKKAAPKKKLAVKKKAAPKKKAAVTGTKTWKVECSVDGVIQSGLTKAEAMAISAKHENETGHRTTFTNEQ